MRAIRRQRAVAHRKVLHPRCVFNKTAKWSRMNNNASRQAVPRTNYAGIEDNSMSRVVVADKDIEFGAVLKQHLERDRFSITLVHDAEEAVRQALSGKHDAV